MSKVALVTGGSRGIGAATAIYLAEKGYDKTFGARSMARLIQTEVKQVLADEILFGQLEEGGEVEIDLDDEKLTFSYAPTASDKEELAQPAETVE